MPPKGWGPRGQSRPGPPGPPLQAVPAQSTSRVAAGWSQSARAWVSSREGVPVWGPCQCGDMALSHAGEGRDRASGPGQLPGPALRPGHRWGGLPGLGQTWGRDAWLRADPGGWRALPLATGDSGVSGGEGHLPVFPLGALQVAWLQLRSVPPTSGPRGSRGLLDPRASHVSHRAKPRPLVLACAAWRLQPIVSPASPSAHQGPSPASMSP